jgi:hypothetical protein
MIRGAGSVGPITGSDEIRGDAPSLGVGRGTAGRATVGLGTMSEVGMG